jgi:hypothetical protein
LMSFHLPGDYEKSRNVSTQKIISNNSLENRRGAQKFSTFCRTITQGMGWAVAQPGF